MSLGVNLSPTDGKVCSFDCLYCEAGFNAQGTGSTGLPPRDVVRRLLEEQLKRMTAENSPLDVITFSGNGEPTLHPDFVGIVDDALALRDRYFPGAKVSVLSNATRLKKPEVVEALRRVDNNILKLDSALTASMRTIDRPVDKAFTSEGVIDDLKRFAGTCVVQTMMVRGAGFDNTTDAEVAALAEAYRQIRPREVMLYSIDRPTPDKTLTRVEKDELTELAQRLTSLSGVNVYAY